MVKVPLPFIDSLRNCLPAAGFMLTVRAIIQRLTLLEHQSYGA